MFFIRILFVILFTVSFAIADGGSGGTGGTGGSGGDGANYGKYSSELKPIFVMINNEMYEDALIELEAFVYENPQSADGWNSIGFASRKLGNFEDAERYYNLGLEINSKHKGILEYQGELYIQTNRIEKAKENLAILDKMCSFNCSYRDKLARKIDDAIASAF